MPQRVDALPQPPALPGGARCPDPDGGSDSGDLRTGAGPVAAQGWSGAGMFALTICQKGGCPWPLLGSPSPCPGAQAQLSPQLRAAGEEEGSSGPLGNSRSGCGTKGSFLRPASPLAPSRPLLSPALGDPSPNSCPADPPPPSSPLRQGFPARLRDYANPCGSLIKSLTRRLGPGQGRRWGHAPEGPGPSAT